LEELLQAYKEVFQDTKRNATQEGSGAKDIVTARLSFRKYRAIQTI